MAKRDDLIETLKDIGGLKCDCNVSMEPSHPFGTPHPADNPLFEAFKNHVAELIQPESWKKLDRAAYLIEQVILHNGGVWVDNGIDTPEWRFPNLTDEYRVGMLSEVARIISDVQEDLERG